MLQMQQSSIFADSPSFNSYSCDKFAEIAAKVSEEFSGEREEFGLESIIDHQFHPVVVVVEQEQEEEEEEEMSTKELQIIVPEQQQQQQRQKQEEQDQENKKVEENKEGGDDDEEDFEFAFVCRDQDGSPITADEIFSNGQIKPFFPVFNRDLLFDGGQDDESSKAQEEDDDRSSSSHRRRNPLKKLLIEDREPQSSSSSSEADELEGLPEGTYCVWTPKPVEASLERCKKSSSTGTSRRWRFRDFLFRSNSDGKDTFVFLTPSPSRKKRDEKAAAADHHQKSTQVSDQHRKLKTTTTTTTTETNNNKVVGGGKMKSKEASAHEMHYIRNRAMKEGDKRRSYLPYRQDLVGIFSNVNGLSRNLHPF